MELLEPEKQQTRRSYRDSDTLRNKEGVLESQINPRCLGEFHYYEGRFSSTILVPEATFSDLWAWVRMPGAKFHELELYVFGNEMRSRIGMFRDSEFRWDLDPDKNGRLMVASFNYVVGSGDYQVYSND